MYSKVLDYRQPSILSSGVTAVCAVLVCALFTFATPLHATHTIFATLFIPAVLASAWYGGTRWGLIATGLSSTFMLYFVLEPVHSLKIDTAEDAARIVAFVFVGICISFGIAFERRIRDTSLENAERLRTTLESIGDAVMVTNANGAITMMNAVAERLTGWSASDAEEKHLREVFHVVDEQNQGNTLDNVHDVALPLVIRLPERSVLVSRGGSEHPIEANVALIRDASTVFGIVIVFRDVTAQRRYQRETEENARRLRELAQQRQQLLRQEQSARNEAVAANRMKDDFLAMVSHELRTPLTSIIGWAGIMRAKRVAPEMFSRGLETIERNAQVQLQLVEDLLDSSRITAGTFRIEKRPVEIDGIVTNAIDGLRVVLDKKHITLTFNAQRCPTMYLDPNRLQQVLWNLLSNAIKFTPPQGHIAVQIENDGQIVQIRVVDDGQGFDPDFESRLFHRFQQADRKAGKQGLGLGLAIARHIVEMHGGTIRGHSHGPNTGATFTVSLPIVADAESPNHAIRTGKTA